jgi:hypothetical protein
VIRVNAFSSEPALKLCNVHLEHLPVIAVSINGEGGGLHINGQVAPSVIRCSYTGRSPVE